MLCSLGELGLTKHDFPYAIEDGIFILGEDCTLVPGTPICPAIGLDDMKVEFEITSTVPTVCPSSAWPGKPPLPSTVL